VLRSNGEWSDVSAADQIWLSSETMFYQVFKQLREMKMLPAGMRNP
jgi:hypothetical protein